MKHQLKQVFHSGKFVFGFVLFTFILLMAIIYPMVSRFGPLEMVGSIFYKPGTYVAVQDSIETQTVKFDIDAMATKLEKNLSMKEREEMATWLANYAGIAEEDLDTSDPVALVNLWHTNYDAANPQEGLLLSQKKAYVRLNTRLKSILDETNIYAGRKDEEGLVEPEYTFGTKDYVRVNDVVNRVTLPLGSDNFGRDILTELTFAIRQSLKIGLIAGLIATIIGLTLGLLSGYVGGVLDNFITFLTNIFTVIPGFVILILVANSLGQAARGIEVVALIIGLTSWPWTTRSVRSQVISLRNRDHVSLSKLSGHTLPRIIIIDILPYVASYVVMALILQVSSGILAEAQLSMLGLGPATSTTTTLGVMMQWANKFQAAINGAWWAFIPVILSIAAISFSLNLMNTGLDQVFNPQLRED